MSRYEMFQKWWAKATGGPGDYCITKRSAQIGFEAALDIAEEKLNNTQQLKAEIRLLAESIEAGERGIGSITKGAIVYRLRELSAA